MTVTSVRRLRPHNVAPLPSPSPLRIDRLGEPDVSFVVYGAAAPQGSKKEVGKYGKSHKRAGQAIMVESSKKVAPWRQNVAAIAADATGFPDSEWEPLCGALVVDFVFTMWKPATFPRSAVDLRRLHGHMTSYPDVSKLARSTEDAMTKIVWHDDARICGYRRLHKFYVGEDDPDVLREPGAVIRVWQVD